MGEWKEYCLGEITDWYSGGTPPKGNISYWNGDIPWISAKTMTTHKVFESSLNISKEGLENGSRIADKNDILLLVRGSGLFNEIPINWVDSPVAFNQDIKSIRARDKENQEFIYYWLHGMKRGLKARLETTGIGAGKFDMGRLKKMTIKIPTNESEKEQIVNTAKSIFSKIDLLHRQNKTLEAMAETLFREWFVEGAEADLALLDFIEINPKESIAKGEPAPYLEMKNVQTDDASPLDWYRREFKSGTKFKNGDTLMARITPCLQNGKKAFVQFLNEGEVGWGSTEYLVFRTKDDFHPLGSYLLAKNESFKSFAEKTMTGSSGRQRVQTDSLKQFKLNKPSDKKIAELNKIFDSVADKLKINASQIGTLESLRDTLLPKLMSGEVRIPADG